MSPRGARARAAGTRARAEADRDHATSGAGREVEGAGLHLLGGPARAVWRDREVPAQCCPREHLARALVPAARARAPRGDIAQPLDQPGDELAVAMLAHEHRDPLAAPQV